MYSRVVQRSHQFIRSLIVQRKLRYIHSRNKSYRIADGAGIHIVLNGIVAYDDIANMKVFIQRR